MVVLACLLLLCAAGRAAAAQELFQENRRLAKGVVEALQDARFDDELLFDLKKENQVFLNRTMSLIIKYVVKREVDNYRSRRTDAISRRIYSSLIMKLIDIAKMRCYSEDEDLMPRVLHLLAITPLHRNTVVRTLLFHCTNRCDGGTDPVEHDLPRNTSSASRIDTAHRYYMSVESRDMHDQMADVQVFHACARLYDVMFTAPRILSQLGSFDDLTPKILVRKLKEMEIKPVHLAVALLIQYHLRNTVNFAIQSKAIEVLATKPQEVGPRVIEMLKALASRLLPISELLDVHLAHSSPAFKDTCPASWLSIVNNKHP